MTIEMKVRPQSLPYTVCIVARQLTLCDEGLRRASSRRGTLQIRKESTPISGFFVDYSMGGTRVALVDGKLGGRDGRKCATTLGPVVSE